MSVNYLDFVGVAVVAALVVQVVAFVIAIRFKRADIVDVAWGLSFIAIVGALQLASPSTLLWVAIVDVLVVVWGLRLSMHIYGRLRRTSKQDERYTNIINKWPDKFRSGQLFVRVFLLQALLAVTISLPVIAIHSGSPTTSLLTVFGLGVWIIGFLFESIADRQLKDFLAKPQHADLMTQGLWAYSRHPNYFGEVAMWWGVAFIALPTGLWPFGLAGAVTITILICFVSGVPLAEKRSATKKGWQKYKQRTSVLIPWPPKK